MTFLELTTLHYLNEYQKTPFDDIALTNLMYIVVAIRRQPKRMWEIIQHDSKAILQNVLKTSKKFVYLRKLVENVKSKYDLAGLESVAFVCWYTFNYIDFKSFEKNKFEDIDENIMYKFNEWYKTLNSNLHIVHGFKKSCKTIMKMRKKNGESAVGCLCRLIEEDKISEVYYAGGVTPYFLAAIPKKKIHIPKSAIFSSKLFSLVDENKDILISKLNNASKNYLKVPVNSIDYLTVLQHVKR